MNNTRRFDVGLQLVGQNTTTPDIAGEIRFNSSLNAFEYFDGTSLRVAVSRDLAETLSNKTLSSTVSITGQAGSPLNISSGTNQNLSLQAAGTGVVLVEDLSFEANTVTGGASQLTIRSASTQDLALSAQGAGGSVLLNTNGNLRVEITDAGLINVPGLTASLPVQTDASKNLVSAAIDLATSQVTGILPIANGGTGSGTQNFVDLTTAQTVGGAKSFSSAVTVTPTTNQLVLGTTNTTTLNAPAPSASRVVTIPDAGTNSDVVLNQGASTINGSKTFSSAVTVTPTTNQLVLGTTNTTTINATAPAASRTYTLPDVLANADFVMTAGNQGLSGRKNFNTQASILGFIDYDPQNDSTTSGSSVTLSVTKSFLRLSNSGLVSVAGIGATDTGRILVISNATGNAISILNDTTATASQRILTGTGNDLSLANNASIQLIYDNTTARWRIVGGSGGGVFLGTNPTVQRFLSGSGTYTTPAGVAYIKVTAVGGGGGGSGSVGNGFSGGGAGGAGGNTTFGSSLITANGGSGGTDSTGGAGGTVTVSGATTVVANTGAKGQSGNFSQVVAGSGNGSAVGGLGGSSFFGGSGSANGGANPGGSGITNTGSGGSGGSVGNNNNQSLGGSGGGAGGYVEAFIPSPAASYSYSVGTSGSAGTAGTSGQAGGSGGSGIIIVEEFYNAVGVTDGTNQLLTPADNDVHQVYNAGITTAVGSNALTISLKDRNGNDPSVSSPVKISFRSTTATSGTYSVVSVTSPLSLTISSGSTLGHTSGNSHVIYVYGVNTASGVVLGASSYLFDESELQTTTAEGGSGGADSLNTLYTTAVQTGRPIRLLGTLISTQTTAGTWATVPQNSSVSPRSVGSFITDRANSNLRLESVLVGGNVVTPTINAQSSNWATGVTRNATGDYTINIRSGIFTGQPMVTATAREGTTANRQTVCVHFVSVSNTAIRYKMSLIDDNGGSATTVTDIDSDCHLMVIGFPV